MTGMRFHHYSRLTAAIALGVLLSLTSVAAVRAAAPLPENPQSSSTGLQGTVASPPPTQTASIASPANGASYTSLPITMAGLCKTGLLVKVFDNNIFMGSVPCTNGSYSLSIDLFSGQNDLIVRLYDALDQAGPDSSKVTVQFNDGQFGQFASRVSLTSIYARRGANPSEVLSWPIMISGGQAPYAISADWGDGSTADLMSVQSAGSFTIQHTYKSAGQYKVTIKATDKNGTAAYLQVVGVGNGVVSSTTTAGTTGTTTVTKQTIWWPAFLLVPFTLIAGWLGKRHELYTLRRTIERQRSGS